MENKQILDNISELRSKNEARIAKYNRNWKRYCYTITGDIENLRESNLVGYYQISQTEQDILPGAQLNVIKSCIDTLVSKISQSKVRPFFNTINGSWSDMQTVKQVQQFFDVYYDNQKVYSKVSDAFRDACIFDTGFLFIDPVTKSVERILPWHVNLLPAEASYNKMTRVYIEQKDYPTTLLSPEFQKRLYCTKGTYIDTVNKVYVSLIDGKIVSVDPWEKPIVPIVKLQYDKSVFGLSSQSVVDMLITIQRQIDSIIAKIQEATELSPANIIFVPEGSGINVTKMNNRTGNVMTYKMNPSLTTSPVTVATPPIIDPMYQMLLDKLEEEAYNMVGISMLSAQSKKPSGIDSGIALTTMEDISSERFETQLQQIINCYVDIAKTAILVFDPNEDVLPEEASRVKIKWKDITERSEGLTIQYSAGDKLSKDPSTKIQQLQMLSQAGIIPQTRIAQFLEIPDIEAGYNLTNNAISAVMSVIQECIEKDNFDVPTYIPFLMLKEEIISTQMSLHGANYEGNRADIDKLTKLYQITEDLEAQYTETLAVDTIDAMAQQPVPADAEQPIPQATNVLTQEANMVEDNPSQTWEHK